jgi:hypothetical protein
MKTFLTILTLSLFAFASVAPAGHTHRSRTISHSHISTLDDINIEFDDKTLVMTSEDGDDVVEITEDYKLYINDKLIKTDQSQEALLKEFYEQTVDLTECAVAIGAEGAKVGLAGAKVGLHAVNGVLKVLFTDYDSDDLERDIEREAAKVEAKAKLLEDKAEKIEDMADDLEDIYDEMEESIPELRDLDWS